MKTQGAVAENRFGVVCLRGSWTLLLILLLAGMPVFAQSSGTILGVVKDTSGASVPEANVTIVNADTSQSRTATTGDDGAFRVSAVPVGHYNVRIEKQGFKTATQQGLVLDVAQELVVNVAMEVGSSAQEIVVTGEAPLVNTTTSTLGGLVNEDKMADLPLNGRNYIDLSLMQAGVSLIQNHGNGGGMAGTWFSSNGAPQYSNYITIDGAPMINMMGGNTGSQAGTTLGVDGIKEYKVITSTFDASYGMTMGSQMVAVSKGGTNSWHGSGFEYLRNDHLDARNNFDTPATAGLTLAGAQRRLPPFRRNNFGASGGGPIRKDKTFVYAVYEGLRQNQGFTAGDLVPSDECYKEVNGLGGRTPFTILPACDPSAPAGGFTIPSVMHPYALLFPEPQSGTSFAFPSSNLANVDFGQIRADHTFSGSDSLFGRYTIDNGKLNNSTLSLATVDNGVAMPGFRILGISRNQFLSVGENHIFSASVLNTARVSFSRTMWDDVNVEPSSIQTSSTPGLIINAPLPAPMVPGTLGMATLTVIPYTPAIGPTQSGGAPPGLSSYHIQNIYTFSDDVFYTHGKHALKFGMLFNRYNDGLVSILFGTGALSFNSLDFFYHGYYNSFSSANLDTNPLGYASVNRYFLYNTLGFYAQDDWRATSRLTVNLGLREEFASAPYASNGRGYALQNFTVPGQNPPGSPIQGAIIQSPQKANFSPRVGLAWDVFGNGKTSIRSGFGLYYDIGNIGAALLQQVITAPPVSTESVHVNPQASPAVLPLNPDGSFSFGPSDIAKALHSTDYNSGQPHMLQWNLSVEQQLPGGGALSVAYVGTRGIHLWQEPEANPTLVPFNQPCGVGLTSTCYSTISNGVMYWSTTMGGGCANNSLLANGTFCRRNNAWASAIMTTTAGDSNYNALQVVMTKRLSRGLQFQGQYTWSHSIDDTEGQMYSSDCSGAAGMFTGVTPWNQRNDRGPSCMDIRHNLRFNMLYHFPNLKSNGYLSKVTNGWWIGSIVSVQTGYAFTPMLAANRSGSGTLSNFADRANFSTATVAPGQTDAAGVTNTSNVTFVPYDPNTVIVGTSAHWFNPLMFVQSRIVPCPGLATLNCGTLGNVGRGILRGPGLGTWDFSLTKDTALRFLGEGGNLQFRAEFFNLLNHVNFGMPIGTTFAGTASNLTPYSNPSGFTASNPGGSVGQITTTSVNSRQIQLALRLSF